MAKKRKKIRRPQTPPLSWGDKAIYCALFLLLIGGMILAVVLMDALRAKIAYREPTALAFRGRLAYLWLFPFFAHLALGCAIPLTVAHEERQPIFGNKIISYGEQPWQKDLFPLFGPQHRKIERPPYAKQIHRIGQIAWVAGLILVLLSAALCLCRRNTLRSDQTIAVYDTFNRQTTELSIPEDYTELTIEAERYRSGKYGTTKWRYEITLLDTEGKEYSFSCNDFCGNQREILNTMLEIKGLFPPESITLQGLDQLERTIAFFHLDPQEAALLRELFQG